MLYASVDKGKNGGFDDSPHNKVIATYRLDSIDIHLKRLLITEINAYPFYSPMYYSDEVYVYNEPRLNRSSVMYIVVNKDTIFTMNKCSKAINNIPEVIRLSFSGGTELCAERIYFDSSAFLNKPKAPFWSQFSFWPLE